MSLSRIMHHSRFMLLTIQYVRHKFKLTINRKLDRASFSNTKRISWFTGVRASMAQSDVTYLVIPGPVYLDYFAVVVKHVCNRWTANCRTVQCNACLDPSRVIR